MRARTLAFSVDGLDLAAELVVPDEPRCTVVLCHGIPGGGPPDPSDPGYPGLARVFAARGAGAAWFNFRGCRDAPGDFSMAGWVRDLGAALDAVAPHAVGPVVVVASSAGGSAALRAVPARADVAAVATLAAPAAFDLLGDDPAASVRRFRNLGIIRDPAFPPDVAAWGAEFGAVAPLDAVASLRGRPLLIVHGDADTVVPYEHAEMLFERAREPKELVRVPGGGHQLRRDARAVDAVWDWIERRVVPSASSRARSG